MFNPAKVEGGVEIIPNVAIKKGLIRPKLAATSAEQVLEIGRWVDRLSFLGGRNRKNITGSAPRHFFMKYEGHGKNSCAMDDRHSGFRDDYPETFQVINRLLEYSDNKTTSTIPYIEFVIYAPEESLILHQDEIETEPEFFRHLLLLSGTRVISFLRPYNRGLQINKPQQPGDVYSMLMSRVSGRNTIHGIDNGDETSVVMYVNRDHYVQN